MGPKTLSAIRQELEHALTATGQDPIGWLEERVTAVRGQDAVVSGGSEVLDSLQRFLEAAPSKARRKQRVGTKK